MPRIKYRDKKFNAEHLDIIEKVIGIVTTYLAAGYDLTLRQVYYQMVARDYIPNNQQSYKRLGGIIDDARYAGLIDWDAITDRTRNLRKNAHWDDPADILRGAAQQFQFDKWEDQERRVEVWVEKDALVGIVGQVAEELDVAYFSCRGYTSSTELWSAAYRRFREYIRVDGKEPLVIHLGDHDPSGKDMTRDIEDRLALFAGYPIEVHRIALNMEQIEEYQPPPNPAKLTDSRATRYIEEFGDESWELDALEPTVISELIRERVLEVRDEALWEAAVEREEEAKRLLALVSDNWDEVKEHVRSTYDG